MTYHSGSRAVQDRVGVRDMADHVGRSIGQGLRPVAAAFLELQPMLVLGAADPDTGRVWASPVTVRPGSYGPPDHGRSRSRADRERATR